ncbi:MAG: lytic murein transglycosylase [Acidimicrobiales bacterium]
MRHPTPRLREIARLAAPRGVPWLLTIVLAIGLASSVAVRGNPAGTRVPAGKLTHSTTVKLGTSLAGPLSGALRALPHDRSASAGIVPFAAPPPKRRRGGIPAGASSGVPAVAIAAYEHAQSVVAQSDASCHLSWEDVAGIGRVESDNGQTWGSAARVTTNGTLFPPIFGPALNGLNGTPAMRGPGGGWVRAEGPMQFLPATWAEYAQDGNGDGQKNPQNFYDAALTTGVFLCANGGNLKSAGGLKAAIFAYNHSTEYGSLVESWIAFYDQVGASALENAGEGLLPVGTPSPQHATGHHDVKATESPAAVVAAAALGSSSAGSFSFGVQALAGSSELASGSGVVNTHDGSGSLTLQVTGFGSLQVRVIGGATFVSLPSGLSSEVGAEGPWIALTPTVLSRLPASISAGLAVESNDLIWLVGQLSGASDMHVAGHTTIDGHQAVEYAGSTDLDVAGEHLAGSSSDLGRVAAVLGSPHLGIDTWVSENRIQSAVITLGAFAGIGPVGLRMTFSGYGMPVAVAKPRVSSISTPTTTTTTTTTTTSTTTTTTTTTIP